VQDKIGGKLVLITNRKSYMSFRLVPKSVTLNDVMALILCVILTNLVVSGVHCVRVVDKAVTMDNLRILCQVVIKNVCRGTARRPLHKYSITARWKFCSRFINLRLNAQYLPSYRLLLNEVGLGSLFWYFEVRVRYRAIS